MSDEDQQNQRKRTAKASAAPHKATCACPRCRYRRRAAGEADVMMPPKSQPGGAPEPGRAPAFDKDMVQSVPSTVNLSNSIVPSTSTAAPHGEAAPGKGATPLEGRRVGAGTAQKNSRGDRLNADLDLGASGRVEVQAPPQVPKAERELAAPSLTMRCQRCDLVVPAPERPGHAARCHVGYDEHEARRWAPI